MALSKLPMTGEEVMTIRRFIAVCLMALAMPFTVCAAGKETFAPVSVISETENVAETFTYILSDASGEIDRIAVEAGSEGKFSIPVSEPGVLSFTVRQVPGKDPDAHYDNTVYQVDVHTVIENEALKTQTVVYVSGSDQKTDGCRFVNRKEAEAIPDIETPKEEPPKKKTITEFVQEIIKTGTKTDLGLWFLASFLLGIGAIFLFFEHKKGDDL